MNLSSIFDSEPPKEKVWLLMKQVGDSNPEEIKESTDWNELNLLKLRFKKNNEDAKPEHFYWIVGKDTINTLKTLRT